jgi:hypothetical protein
VLKPKKIFLKNSGCEIKDLSPQTEKPKIIKRWLVKKKALLISNGRNSK